MKNKLVIWGTNTENEKVLIALELQADANRVMLYTFPEAIANDEFVNKMMNEWRNGGQVAFPEGHGHEERELSIAEGLLTEDLKVDRPDIIQRAQTEWHFVVLSSKLHEAYQQELQEFKEKVQALAAYDNGVWESLRNFWDKVQNQSRERNLFREHADNLRDNINILFDDLKKMKNRVQSEFMVASEKVYQEFIATLDDIEKRTEAGGNKLHSVFEDLKQLQRKYRDARMSNEHRNQLWERLDGAFKAAKERKFGPGANDGSVAERQERRLAGLHEAVKRMEDSLKRDEEELAFQRKKIDATEGQLEAQIRMAKIKMIEERLNSKREKLIDMQRTANDVQRQAGVAKDKEHRRAEKDADRRRLDEAKETARSEIAANIRTRRPGNPPRKEESLVEAAGTVLGDVLMDALDSFKAVASVAMEKGSEVLHDMAEKANDMVEKASDMVESMTQPAEAEAPEANAAAEKEAAAPETVAEAAVEATEPVLEAVAEAAHTVAEAPEAIAEAVTEAAEPVAEAVAEAAHTVAEAPEAIAEAVAEAAEPVAEAVAEAAHTVAEAPEAIAEAAEPVAEAVAEAPEAIAEAVAEASGTVTAETEEVHAETEETVKA